MSQLFMAKSSLIQSAYKALMLDVDGTTIPNQREAFPSRKVFDAINKAKKVIHVGLATGRPLFVVEKLLKHLDLSGPSIINGGAQIIDSQSFTILSEQLMEANDINKIYSYAKHLPSKLIFNDDENDYIMPVNPLPDRVISAYIGKLDKKVAEALIDKASGIKTIAMHMVPSWVKGKFDVTINHAAATKQHGILQVAKILKINTHEIIGVGDGYNDFPLLMACGLRIAMGNAVPELKEIADYVAPTVDEDGVADVIEKYILSI